MITLYQYPSKLGLPNISNFCLKLEGWLKMAELEYSVRDAMNPAKTPKGKMPFIKDTDGTIVADSSIVIDYLTKKYNVHLDDNLTPLQRAQATTLQRLMEDHLYWVTVYSRWIDEICSATILDTWFGGMPFPMKHLVPIMAQRGVKQNLHAQGLGRHDADEIYRQGKEDVDALAAILETQPYLLGEQPQGIDASGFSWLANLILIELPDTPITTHAKQYPQFTDYLERMRAQYWANDERFNG